MQLEKDLQAARATLIALRAVLPSPPAIDPPLTVVLNGSVMSRDAAAVQLASMPKPVLCAGASHDGYLSLECKTIEDHRDRVRFERWVSLSVAPDLDFVRGRYSGEHDRPRILLRGIGEMLVLSIEEYEQWLRTYDLEGVNTAMDKADREARASGATALLTVHPSAPGFELDVRGPSEE